MLNPATAKVIPPETLRLGFGCAWLTAGNNLDRSLRLVQSALDAGITYFDTARLYGDGSSERLLGTVAASRRDRMIITSKLGIIPGRRTLARRVLRKAHKLVSTALPRVGRHLPDPPMVYPLFHAFSPDQMRASIDTTLRELGTDYLDVLLLHECSPDDLASGEVMGFAEELKRQGKIREFGIATGIDETIAILKSRADLFAVQFSNNLWNDNISRLPPPSVALIGTHSVLAGRLEDLRQRLRNKAELAQQWRRLTGIDPNDSRAIGQLFLAHALRTNPEGIVLFSSSNPQNIAAGARVAAGAMFEKAQIDGLVQAIQLAYPATPR